MEWQEHLLYTSAEREPSPPSHMGLCRTHMGGRSFHQQSVARRCQSLDDTKRQQLEVQLLDCFYRDVGRALGRCTPAALRPLLGGGGGECLFGLRVTEADHHNLLVIKTKVTDLCLFLELQSGQQRSEVALEALQSAAVNASLALLEARAALTEVALTQQDLEAQLQEAKQGMVGANEALEDLSSRARGHAAALERAEARVAAMDDRHAEFARLQERVMAVQGEVAAALETVSAYSRTSHRLLGSLLGRSLGLRDVGLYSAGALLALLGPWPPRVRLLGLLLVGMMLLGERQACGILVSWGLAEPDPASGGEVVARLPAW